MCDVVVGRARTREVKTGSNSSMTSGFGGVESGETRGCVKVDSVRVWCDTCVIRAV